MDLHINGSLTLNIIETISSLQIECLKYISKTMVGETSSRADGNYTIKQLYTWEGATIEYMMDNQLREFPVLRSGGHVFCTSIVKPALLCGKLTALSLKFLLFQLKMGWFKMESTQGSRWLFKASHRIQPYTFQINSQRVEAVTHSLATKAKKMWWLRLSYFAELRLIR